MLPLDPDRFFLADDERDFALVAVRATAAELAPFGFNPLIEAEGKAIIGEYVTIVQHPRGEKKQVALRENKIVDIPDRFLHYAADTEPGSSGSPVFNDQWEVVALHHASVPAPDHQELGGFMNEGIRVSRILKFVREEPLDPPQRALADQLIAPDAPEGRRRPPAAPAPAPVAAPSRGHGHRAAARSRSASAAASRRPSSVPEAVTIDPDYASREGYDADFLAHAAAAAGTRPRARRGRLGRAEVPPLLRRHAPHTGARAADRVNVDGARLRVPERSGDRWFLDPRLPVSEQTGEAVYRDNPLDRGHLVRRRDPAWGDTDAQAKAANDDTFHYTNAAPQHHLFNAGRTLWVGLEDYVLQNADTRDLQISVFTGPVLAPDDDPYRGVQLPRQFWKVVAMVKTTGELSVTGYLLSQAALLDELPAVEAFSYGAYRTFQVPVRRIAELTGLGFDPHIAADPLERIESTPLPRELIRPADLLL